MTPKQQQNPNSSVMDHMFTQREEHHSQSCGQMDTLIHQNEELKRVMIEGFAQLSQAILSLSASPASTEVQEPLNTEIEEA